MPNIIDSIQISSSTFDVRDKSATTVVNLTQEQYDNLPSSAKTANVLYNITDATAGDLSQYWTSAQTQSAITQATSGLQETLSAGTGIDITDNVISATGGGGGITSGEVQTMIDESISGKADSSDVYTKSETSGATEIATALSGKQDTLSAGTNITIVGNVISAEGGGKAISAGTNISVTTGETADTINCTLPITATSNVFNAISVGKGSRGGSYNTLIGPNARCDNNYGHNVFLVAQNSSNSASGAYVNGINNVIIGSMKDGYLDFNLPSFSTSNSVVIGGGEMSTDKNNSLAIGYNAKVSGTTKTNINNQLTIDTSNQVYIYNKDNTEMICLQDALGGGGGGIDSGTVQTMIDESISGKADTSSLATVATSGSYNDLTNKPTIPTSASQLTNDAGYLVANDITGKTDTTAFTAHTASTVHMTTTEKTNLDSLATNIAAISGITSTKVGNWDTASTNSHTHSNKTVLDGINSTKVSNWDGAATNASNAVTALGGLSLVKLTQSAYDALTTKDSNTLYVIVN